MTLSVLLNIGAAVGVSLLVVLGYAWGQMRPLEPPDLPTEKMIRKGVEAFDRWEYDHEGDPEPGEKRAMVEAIWVAMRPGSRRL